MGLQYMNFGGTQVHNIGDNFFFLKNKCNLVLVPLILFEFLLFCQIRKSGPAV